MPYKEEKAHPGPLLVQVELAAGALVVQRDVVAAVCLPADQADVHAARRQRRVKAERALVLVHVVARPRHARRAGAHRRAHDL